MKKIKCHIKKKIKLPEYPPCEKVYETFSTRAKHEYNPNPKYHPDGTYTLSWIVWQAEHGLSID